jgi:4-amino-4-deoxy-L-arabinose transferase-like glycosyltransferase
MRTAPEASTRGRLTLAALVMVFLLAMLFRFYALGSAPVGLSDDEISNAYVGAFILRNGVDLYGNAWPLLYFDKFGDFPPVLPMYLSGLGTFLFGNSVFGARAVIAFLGAMAVIPVYGIALRIFGSRRTALFAAGFLALTPWHIAFSRVNAEGIAATTVFFFGLWILLEAIIGMSSQRGADTSRTVYRHRSLLMLAGGSALLMSTYLLYPGFRIFVPITFACIALYAYLRDRETRRPAGTTASRIPGVPVIAVLVLSLLAFALTFLVARTEWGRGRAEQTSIFNDVSGVTMRTQQFIMNEDNLTVARIFNNKPLAFAREFMVQYGQYWSPDYLFFSGGLPKHYRLPNSGLLPVAGLALLVALLIVRTIKKPAVRDGRLFDLMLVLLLLAPVPAALTVVDAPHMHRSLPMSVLFVFAAAYAFHALKDIRIGRIPAVAAIYAILVLETVFFSHNYLQHVTYHQAVWRNDGNKELIDYIRANESRYEAIYVTREQRWLPVYYLYYTGNYDRALAGKWERDFKFAGTGKVRFMDQDCASDQLLSAVKNGTMTVPGRSLVVDSGQCEQSASVSDPMFGRLNNLLRADASVAFILLETR